MLRQVPVAGSLIVAGSAGAQHTGTIRIGFAPVETQGTVAGATTLGQAERDAGTCDIRLESMLGAGAGATLAEVQAAGQGSFSTATFFITGLLSQVSGRRANRCCRGVTRGAGQPGRMASDRPDRRPRCRAVHGS